MNPYFTHMGFRHWRAALVLALACAGCTAPPVKEPDRAPPPATGAKPVETPSTTVKPEPPPPVVVAPKLSPSQQELEDGIKSYEDGQYKVATKQVQAALDLGLATPGEQAKAHKYLAFIDCVSGRPNGCRAEFRKAFAADPGFDLTPAEAGHPMWGPAFKSVKAAVVKAKPK
jgi:hypothetical protein